MLASVLCDHSMQSSSINSLTVFPNKRVTWQCRFNRVRYTIQAVHTMSTDRSLAPIADIVQQVEAKLLRKKTELRQFESEYRQVSSAWHQLSDISILDMSCCTGTGLGKWTCWNSYFFECLRVLMHACVGVHHTITGVTRVLTAEMHVCTCISKGILRNSILIIIKCSLSANFVAMSVVWTTIGDVVLCGYPETRVRVLVELRVLATGRGWHE